MSTLAFAAVLLVTLGWVILPLLPALRELYRPTDVEPLTAVGRDNADIGRFARHFREYLEANLRKLPAEAAGGDWFGRLPDGTHFVKVSQVTSVLERGALPDGSHDRVVALEPAVRLKGGEKFRLEVWARNEFTGGPDATYRALLGDRDLVLGDRSLILRWCHAHGTLRVGGGSQLFGRTSSDTEIRLDREVGFERLGAPRIITGRAPAAAVPVPDGPLAAVDPPPRSRRGGGVLHVEQDWSVPPHSLIEGDVVVAGRLELGAGSRVTGSVKAHDMLLAGPGTVIEGSAVGRGAIHLGERGWIRGPVISEEEIRLGPEAAVGRPQSPTTVSGRTVSLGAGSAIYGHCVTQEGGQTEG